MPESRPPLVVQPLATARLTLTPLDLDRDLDDLHVMLADPAVATFDDGPPSATLAETRWGLSRAFAENGGATWTIRLRDDPTALGTIGVFSDQGTTIRGIGWSLRASHWGQGITGEAARTVVPWLLAQPGVDGLEAWVDVRNVRSIGVAVRAGMRERGHLPRTVKGEVTTTLVLARAAQPVEPMVRTISAVLPVGDVAATIATLTAVFAMHIAWAIDEPPTLACVAMTPWAGSAGIRVAAASGEIVPVAVRFEVGVPVDDVVARAEAAGLRVVARPVDQPWYRREATVALPDGHQLTIAGALSPTG